MSAFTIYNIPTAYLITILVFWRALLISEWRTMTSLQASIGGNTRKY